MSLSSNPTEPSARDLGGESPPANSKETIADGRLVEVVAVAINLNLGTDSRTVISKTFYHLDDRLCVQF